MVLHRELTDQGFSLSNVNKEDFNAFYSISRECYEKYVDEYFGGWIENFQLKMNTDSFEGAMKKSTYKKILLNDEIVGFFSFDELNDKVDGVSIHMTKKARNKGIGTFYLNYITSISDKSKKPILLRVFKSNPAYNLYKRFGFEVYDNTDSHYLMRYDPT